MSIGGNDKVDLLLAHFENTMHDIKTPINIMYLLAQNLERDLQLDPNLLDNVKVIKKYCLKVIKLIYELNDCDKILSGRFSPKLKNYNIVELVKNISLAVAPLAGRRNIQVVFHTDMEQKVLATDRDIFDRILLNLLSNAIKFSKIGGTVYIKLMDEGGRVLVEIADSGPGLKDSSYVFERYVTDGSGENREGSGIGLSLVREMTEVLDGEVRGENNPLGGAVFSLHLPVRVLDDGNVTDTGEDDFLFDEMIQTALFDE